MRLNGTWTVSQPRRFQGDSLWGSAVGQTKLRFQMLLVEGFPEATALWGRGTRHYQGKPPLLRYTPIADTACRCRGNPLQQRDSAAGHSLWQQGRDRSNRANLTPAGRSLGRQIVTRLPPSWAGQHGGHSQEKPQPPTDRASEKKRVFFMSYVAAELNIAT